LQVVSFGPRKSPKTQPTLIAETGFPTRRSEVPPLRREYPVLGYRSNGQVEYGLGVTAMQKRFDYLFFVADLKLHLPPEQIAIIVRKLASSRWVPDNKKK
jgi:hypothetical protein